MERFSGDAQPSLVLNIENTASGTQLLADP
jgi:hypothetical protein